MREQIKVGDLVQVVRPARCGCPTIIGGYVFRVDEIRKVAGCCTKCGAKVPVEQTAWGDQGAVSIWRLKRIPPLDELEGEKRDEEITA